MQPIQKRLFELDHDGRSIERQHERSFASRGTAFVTVVLLVTSYPVAFVRRVVKGSRELILVDQISALNSVT